jgi:septal ring factor EnvC (AmiA/AmiB activator)
MVTEVIKNQTPEERELKRKQTELDSLETELIQRELDLATLRAELAEFESRYLRTVGVLYAELDEIEAQIAEAQDLKKGSGIFS